MLISTVLRTVDIFISFLNLLILLRIIISFVKINPYSSYYRILFQLTEPILEPIRKLISRLKVDTGMFDLSPLIASFFLSYILKPLLYSLVGMFFSI